MVKTHMPTNDVVSIQGPKKSTKNRHIKQFSLKLLMYVQYDLMNIHIKTEI